MKFIFTADLHIKIGQKNVPPDWQRARFHKLFTDIYEYAANEHIPAVIIGGDLFDRIPSMEELNLYFELLHIISDAKVETMLYSGNHEALKKNTTFLSYLKQLSYKSTNGYMEIIDTITNYKGLDIVPYNCLKDYKFTSKTSNILCTHVRGAIPPHVVPEIDLSLLDKWDLVLAGDLHSYSNSQRNIKYPGSPLTTSFHREEVQTGFLVIDSSTLETEFIKLKLPQLIRKTVKSTAEMVQTDFNHTIYEIEGDLAELSKVKGHDLLDKKVVKREAVSSLNLKPSMTLGEELKLYLVNVLSIDENKARHTVELFNDYIKGIDLE